MAELFRYEAVREIAASRGLEIHAVHRLGGYWIAAVAPPGTRPIRWVSGDTWLEAVDAALGAGTGGGAPAPPP